MDAVFRNPAWVHVEGIAGVECSLSSVLSRFPRAESSVSFMLAARDTRVLLSRGYKLSALGFSKILLVTVPKASIDIKIMSVWVV